MDIGLNITDKIRISLNDSIDNLQRKLEDSGIVYSIPFKQEVDGKTREVMFIDSFGVELNTSSNIITFIKTSNSQMNYIMTIEEENPLDALMTIKDNLALMFYCETKAIKVNKFDIKTFSSVMTIPIDDKNLAKLTLVMGSNHNVYLETIKMLAR